MVIITVYFRLHTQTARQVLSVAPVASDIYLRVHMNMQRYKITV